MLEFCLLLCGLQEDQNQAAAVSELHFIHVKINKEKRKQQF